MALFAKVVPEDDHFGAYVVLMATMARDIAVDAGGFSPDSPCYIVTDRRDVRDVVSDRGPKLAELGYKFVLLSYREALETIRDGRKVDSDDQGIFCFGGDQNDYDSFEVWEHMGAGPFSEKQRTDARQDAMYKVIWRVLDYREPLCLDHVIFYVGHAPPPSCPAGVVGFHWNVKPWPPAAAPSAAPPATSKHRAKKAPRRASRR